MTWGIVPAAGIGSRIQPLAFSKELLPVGSRRDAGGVERPRAVCEHIVDRMVLGGADRLCFVIGPDKSDIIEYLGAGTEAAPIAYVVQQRPGGLCDAVFRALPLVAPDQSAIVGLPDTVWFPEDALARLPDDRLSFLCFPVEEPQHFDAVVSEHGRVREIQVKQPAPRSRWIWGAFKLPAQVLRELHALWCEPGRGDAYFGTLVNAWLARGGEALAVHAGEAYADVGTLHGWRDAARLLDGSTARAASPTANRSASASALREESP